MQQQSSKSRSSKPRKWTPEEDHMLLESLQSFPTLNACFMAVARETGRSPQAVSQHYYKIVPSASDVDEEQAASPRKWTKEEDECLLRYLKHDATNLRACFLIVAEQVNRTPGAVAAHWYGHLSKRPDVKMIICATHNSIAINRKNSRGVESNSSIWNRLLRVIKIIGL